MKKTLTTALIFLSAIISSSAQGDPQPVLSYDGLYIAKSGNVPDAGIEIYTYLRFYKDGSVYLQAVSSNDPKAVSAWFGRYKKFSQKGSYQVNGSSISIRLSNKESKDFQLEGLEETSYTGTIKSRTEICLTRDAETTVNCFAFSKVSDTTKLKYSSYKPEIKLPGEWKIKQILKNSGQVFFINEDSTIVAIAVLMAAKLPGYKETQTDFETAYVYYEWDSKYMQDEEKMEVKKIAENKEKAFVIWNAKDANNDNYHLFARRKDLLYNIMIYDTQMPVEKQIKLIELVYDLNKE